MFLVQLGTAFASRAAPRVHVLSLTFAIAVCTGMLALFVATPSLAPALAAEIQQLPTLLREALGGL
jgi:flagellar biosynthesis protein FliR